MAAGLIIICQRGVRSKLHAPLVSLMLLLKFLPVYGFSYTKNIAVYLECICVLELNVYTVDLAA